MKRFILILALLAMPLSLASCEVVGAILLGALEASIEDDDDDSVVIVHDYHQAPKPSATRSHTSSSDSFR